MFSCRVNAALGDFHCRIFNKQIGEEIPLLFVEIVTVHRNEVFNFSYVLKDADAVRYRCQRRIGFH
jgi:hypothetical protein